MITAVQAKTATTINMGFSQREAERYSVAKAILATTDSMTAGGFEKEVSDTLAAQLGRPPRSGRGIFVPTVIRASGLEVKTNAAGGYTTSPQVQDLTDIFRSQLRLVQLGATFIGGLKFNALFPTEDSSVSAYWVTENGLVDVSETNPVFRANLATPHGLSVTSSISSQLLQQAANNVRLEARLRQDIGAAHSAAFELAAINGTGSQGQPTGLLKQFGITIVPIGTDGGAATYDTVLALEDAVGSANAPDQTAWLTTPKVRKQLRKVFVNGTGSTAVWQGSSIFDKPAMVSTAVPSTLSKGTTSETCHALIHGAFSELLLCEFGAMEIVTDFWSKKRQGLVELTSISFVDVVIPRPSAFAAAVDVTVT